MINRFPLGTYCENQIGILGKCYEGLIDYIDISSIDNTEKRIKAYQTLDVQDAPSRAKQLLKKGDILVSIVRPNLNAVALIESKTDNLMVGSTGYCILRCKKNMNAHYVFYFCQSEYFINVLSSQATGASYPAVNNKIVKSSLIPYYGINEQIRIANELDAVSKLIASRKKQLDKLDELVKSRFVELFGDILHDKSIETIPLSHLADVGSSKRIYANEYVNSGIPFVSAQ